MDVIFTDLDGTLLDAENYSWEAARPALDRVRQRGIPWVPVTSKTRAETEWWRGRFGHHHPFIIENGGAAFVPERYFPFVPERTVAREGYHVIELGVSYGQLTDALASASQASGCPVRGFRAMSAEEVAERCDLPPEHAQMARQREYDEPFLVLDAGRASMLTAAIEALGLHWTRGGRFWHILGPNDKADAVRRLAELFRRANTDVRTIGLGDGLNDATFLNAVDIPILIRSPQSAELQRLVPRGSLTDCPGPEGWNQAVMNLTGA